MNLPLGLNTDRLPESPLNPQPRPPLAQPSNGSTDATGVAVCLGLLAMLVLGAGAFVVVRTGVYLACVSTLGVALFVLSLKGEYRREMLPRALIGTFMPPMLAWMLPEAHLIQLVMLFWVPLLAGSVSRIAGVYLFSVLLLPPLDLPVYVGSLKLFDFGILDALVLGSAVAIACRPVLHARRFASDKWVIAVILLLSVAVSRQTSMTNVLRMLVNAVFDLGLPYFVLSRGINGVDQLRAAMRWFACGGVALASLMTFEAFRAWPMYNELYARDMVPTIILVKERAGILRAAGPFMESTSAALVLALCLMALWILRSDFRSRLHHYLLVGLVFLGMSVPQSRGAWIGFFLGLLVLDVYRRDYKRLILKAALFAGGIVLVFAAAHVSSGIAASLGMGAGPDDTVAYRRMLLQRGIEEIMRRPFTGYSTPQLAYILADMRQGEGIIDFVNSYLWVTLVSGVAGLSIFVGAFLSPLIGLWKRRRDLAAPDIDPLASQACAFAFTCLVMLMVMFAFTSFGSRPAFLTFAFFGFALAVRGSDLRSPRTPEAIRLR
ncbi:O-antigen ligase-like membrane protein [Novosphingobium sp. PhB165]|uniref:O-antigen ligase family protein n=1 Tax=Novosphingobium sp. PhB165 TaxID=2485105 RepID=UPI00104612E6|nr:O-antigen ligase family protein [Novosphingobium sp. PhB165]TCM20821.1 O-antigen ligase-like membrane protein [Novosphingobium sp. PhB165]